MLMLPLEPEPDPDSDPEPGSCGEFDAEWLLLMPPWLSLVSLEFMSGGVQSAGCKIGEMSAGEDILLIYSRRHRKWVSQI